MAEVLKEVADEWSLSDKLAASVTDNGRNIVLALQIAGWMRLPCFGHTLQLAVKSGLELSALCSYSDHISVQRDSWVIISGTDCS